MPDWNVAILIALYHIRTPFGVQVALSVSQLGGFIVITGVFLASAYILSRGKPWAHALGLIISLGGAVLTSEILKNVFRFERPDAGFWAVPIFDYGFPSMHSAAAMALYGYLTWYVWEKNPRFAIPAAIFFGAIIFAIGSSRLYLGVHWPIDVIGGYLVGFVFVFLGVRITRKLEPLE